MRRSEPTETDEAQSKLHGKQEDEKRVATAAAALLQAFGDGLSAGYVGMTQTRTPKL